MFTANPTCCSRLLSMTSLVGSAGTLFCLHLMALFGAAHALIQLSWLPYSTLSNISVCVLDRGDRSRDTCNWRATALAVSLVIISVRVGSHPCVGSFSFLDFSLDVFSPSCV